MGIHRIFTNNYYLPLPSGKNFFYHFYKIFTSPFQSFFLTSMNIEKKETNAYGDQAPGTSGLRKKTKVRGIYITEISMIRKWNNVNL